MSWLTGEEYTNRKHETKSCEQNERVDDVPGVYENEAWKCKWQKSKKTWERQRETARLVDCERASEWECSLSCYAGLRLTLCASVLVCIGVWLAVACVCVCVCVYVDVIAFRARQTWLSQWDQSRKTKQIYINTIVFYFWRFYIFN